MKSYRNFDLELSDYSKQSASESLLVRVQNAQRRFESTHVEFPQRLRSRLNRLKNRDVTLEELVALGEDLAGLLFPLDVRILYRQRLASLKSGEGLRVRIIADTPQIAELPWEYAYIAEPDAPANQKGYTGFLALNSKISLVRFEVLSDQTEDHEPVEHDSIRVAALLSEVQDPAFATLNLAQEELNLREALASVGGVDLSILRPGKLTQLQEFFTIKHAQIFHFSGHGELKLEMGEQPGTFAGHGQLILAGDNGQPAPMEAERLAIYLKGRGIRLAMLGACEAARRDPATPWSGVAPALVRQGIPAVVGMQYTVRDGNAVAFSEQFYKALAYGKSVDTAVSEGRQGIFQRAGGTERDWGVPVLYLQTEKSVLFPKPRRPLQINLALAFSALTLFTFGFWLHFYPLVSHGALQWMGKAGLSVGALAGVFALLKLAGSIVLKAGYQSEQDSLIERLMRYRHTRKILWLSCAALLGLWATTNSVYFILDNDDMESVNISVKTSDGEAWKEIPQLLASRTDGRTLAGGPVLFRLPPDDLILRVEDPVGWRVRDALATIQPRPWKSINLNASGDLQIEITYPIRLVFRNNLHQLFARPGNGDTNTSYQLEISYDDEKQDLRYGLSKGVVYFGAQMQVLKRRLDSETIDQRRAELEKCLPPGAGADAMMQEWGPEDENRRHFVEIPNLKEKKSVKVRIFETVQGKQPLMVAEKTLKAEKLRANQLNLFCLSRRSGSS